MNHRCRFPHSILAILAGGILAGTGTGAGPVVWAQNDAIADRARILIDQHCGACHGAELGRPKGGGINLYDFKVVQDDRDYIAEILSEEEMPPKRATGTYEKKYGVDAATLAAMQMPAAARQDLLAWLSAGAPGWKAAGEIQERQFLPYEEAISLMVSDLDSVALADRPHQRYLSLINLYNAGDTDYELDIYREGLIKLLNSLTWQPEIQRFAYVAGSNQTLLRFDLRQMGSEDRPWTAEDWEYLTSFYPYYFPLAGLNAARLASRIESKHYFIRADWFAFAASRPPFYHDLLRLPESLDELADVLGVDVDANIRNHVARRAGTTDSGVSTNHRIIERHPLPDRPGAFWVSYDFRTPSVDQPRRNILKFPLGPGELGYEGESFEHAGGEMIFNLPNGLQGYLLTDDNGGRLDVAPTDIVQNTFRVDASIMNGISCMQCHRDGMRSTAAHVLPFVETTVSAERFDFAEAVARLYAGDTAINSLIEQDKKTFLDAMRQVHAVAGIGRESTAAEQVEPISALVERFEQKVDLLNAAAELNATGSTLQQLFDNPLAKNNPQMIELKARLDFTKISRNDFIVEFGRLMNRFISDEWEENHAPQTFPDVLQTDGAGGAAGLRAGQELIVDFDDRNDFEINRGSAWTLNQRFTNGGVNSLYSRNTTSTFRFVVGPDVGSISFDGLSPAEGGLRLIINGESAFFGRFDSEWQTKRKLLKPGTQKTVEIQQSDSDSEFWIDNLKLNRIGRLSPDRIDFDGDFIEPDVSGDWQTVQDRAFSQPLSKRTPPLSHSRSASMVVLSPKGMSSMTFRYFRSTEYSDELTVLVNGKSRFLAPDTPMNVWSEATVLLDGTDRPRVVFTYKKDSNATSGEDRIWVDDIQFHTAP